MAVSWDLMNEGTDQVALPPPERRMIDKTHFMDISYKQNENGTIERLCRRGEITTKEKKISRASLRRKSNFIKFGKVANKPNGPEKGITATRAEEFGVLWEGLSKQEQKNNAANRLQQQQQRSRQEQKDEKTNDKDIQQKAIMNLRLPKSSNTVNNASSGGRYIPKHKTENAGRAGGAGGGSNDYPQEEEQFEIRISNLPDSTHQEDIKVMMRALFDNEYTNKPYNERQRMPSPPYRIKVYCFKTRIDQETNAIVDVKNEFWRQKCIELLDGQPYGYCIMKVEKSKPRKRRY